MKPIKIRMQGFGPFAKEQEIDFLELGERSLFLICGPTGSGKSTLFDAMCYALYGECSGNRKASDMRSHMGDLSQETWVEFTFSVRDRLYRIFRRPEQEVRKASGKVVKRLTDCDMFNVAGGKEKLLVSQVTPVKKEVHKVLGLNKDQFCQVVMLPQNKFEEILTAKSEVREQVLKVLFQTERFENMQSTLRATAKEAVDEIQQGLTNKKLLLGTFGCETEEALNAKIATADEELTAKRNEVLKLSQDVLSAEKALKKALDIQRKLDEVLEAQKALAQVTSGQAQASIWKEEIEAARRALHVKAVAEAEDQRRDEARQARERHDQMSIAVATAREKLTQSKIALEAAKKDRPQIESLTIWLNELENLKERFASWKDAMAKTRGFSEAQASASRAYSEAAADEKKLRKSIESEEVKLAEAKEAGNVSVGLAAEQKAMSKLFDQKKKVEGYAKEISQKENATSTAEKDFKSVEKKLKDAQKEFESTRTKLLKSHANALAAELIEGQPCPVCGSEKHPKPARGKAIHGIDESEIDELKQNVEALTEEREEKRSNLATLRTDLRVLEGKRDEILEGIDSTQSDLSLAQIKKTVSDLEGRQKFAKAQADLVKSLNPKIRELKIAWQKAEQECAMLKKQLDAVENKLSAARALEEKAVGEIPEDLRGEGKREAAIAEASDKRKKLQARLDQAEETVKHAEKTFTSAGTSLKDADAAVAAAEKAEQGAVKTLKTALKEFNFADKASYLAAVKSPQAMKRLETDYENFTRKLNETQGRLEHAQKSAAGLVPANVVELKEIKAQRDAKVAKAHEENGSLQKNLEEMGKCLREIKKITDELQERERRQRALSTLSELASGKNPHNPGFHRFVLGTLLDQVLQAANNRLMSMTANRYRLERVREFKKSGQFGLELNVHDAHSSTSRSVGTLSGGETFQAALSLALGLADTVQARSGGVKLDTVFVDEGFGSLDPESLGLAMQTMQQLQAGEGRLVGIISHVEELREQFKNTCLMIESSRGVSRARFNVK